MDGRRASLRTRRVLSAVLGLAVIATLAAPIPAIAGGPSGSPSAGNSSARGVAAGASKGQAGQQAGPGGQSDVWQRLSGKPAASHNGHTSVINPKRFGAFTLNNGRLKQLLAGAPKEKRGGRDQASIVVSLPAPDGSLQRFAIHESPIMEDGLAAKHPDIKTYAGKGLDDPTATIRADVTRLGFHASVRSAKGAWYVDPYYHLDDSVYASYYGRDDIDNPHGVFIEDEQDPVGSAEAFLGGEIVAQAGPPGPLVTLRTYRLALVTDNGYADFFGAPNVTAAKVTLINRVTQVYEDESAIRLVLIANTDLLNLNTLAIATGANGPCGTAGCFTAAQINSCSNLARIRIVVGQIIGASNYDIGHLALGKAGGGVANLGVIGRSAKAQGCTGLTAPVGDFYAVDYVAHEMGHQFAGNHTFNGTISNCSGGNRNAGTSVEPGSGSSIMAYAGICGTDNLQPHSDPYWSQRSYQEINTYVSSNQNAINEVQTISLYSWDVNGDSFTINYNGNDSVPIVRGTNYTAAGIQAAILGIPGWPAGATATIANFGGGGSPSDNGFQVTFGGTLGVTNVNQFSLTNFSGASGFVGETDKGGPVDNKGFTAVVTANNAPVVDPLPVYTIPVRTPFTLTGSATDFNDDTITYMWEQNDRGNAGTSLISNTKLNGPLFRQFGVPLQMPPYVTGNYPDPGEYTAPGENQVTTDPSRTFPDLLQILANNTNAVTGTCPAGNTECFSEFLPTAAYVGFAGTNASPARLNFRLTARDHRPGGGGIGTADTVLTLAPAAGPFLVTSHSTAAVRSGGSVQAVTWDVAGTNLAPISTANVRISLSVDGGFTWPYVLAATTANDGSENVTLPNVGTDTARIKIEAIGNVYFDINDVSFPIHAVPVVTNDAPAGGAFVQYSDALSPTVTISANDPDGDGSAMTAIQVGLPAGLSLAVGTTSADGDRPGTRTWTVVGNVTAAPGSYPVTVIVTDGDGEQGSTSFTIVVTKEDADATYTGDMLAFTPIGGSTANVVLRATIRDSAIIPLSGDTAPGDIRNATVTFKEGATTLCGPLAVQLIDGALTTGTASCTKALGLGAHTIDIYINNYYTGLGSGIVEVAAPDGSFITGGGYRTIAGSAGKYSAADGSKMNFGFNVKYTKNMKGLQGHMNLIFRSGGRTYQIKSTATDSLGIVLRTSGGTACAGPVSATCWGLADFRSKANLTDVTDPLAPIGLGGNLTLQVTMTDKGEPGSSDTIGVTLWDGPTLVFSSAWSGTKTLEGLLAGGNIVVH